MVHAPKRVLLGITGSIAAYKSLELIRLLRNQEIAVQVVATQEALALVSPLALQAVSGHPVRHTLWDPQAEHAMDHIQLARWPDLVVVAPATAHTLARFAMGLADDLLGTLYLATQAPVWVAPAMNQAMWSHPATQQHVALLQQRGVQFWGPDQGAQACGETGPGRLVAPESLAQAIGAYLQTDRANPGYAPRPKLLPLQGVRMVITAGPTREPLDPVRFISNYSSGKMGYAVARAACAAGAQVHLISGPVALTPPVGLARYTPVQTAEEMYTAVMQDLPEMDVFVALAAVADYKPVMYWPHKHKKYPRTPPTSPSAEHPVDPDRWIVELEKNPDILAAVAQQAPHVWTIGCAAETEYILENALEKKQRKHVSWMLANQVGRDAAGCMHGFDQDRHAWTLLSDDGNTYPFGPCSKDLLAQQLMEHLVRYGPAHLFSR